MHTIVVASQKGGSGKTTLARNLAVASGADVALIDTDPQGSLTRRATETVGGCSGCGSEGWSLNIVGGHALHGFCCSHGL